MSADDSSSAPLPVDSDDSNNLFNDSAADEKLTGARVKVKKWNAVTFWSYDIENDTCAICHNQLMVPCITCEAEPHHAEECSVAWGQCSHSYHFHVRKPLERQGK